MSAPLRFSKAIIFDLALPESQHPLEARPKAALVFKRDGALVFRRPEALDPIISRLAVSGQLARFGTRTLSRNRTSSGFRDCFVLSMVTGS
ncbi:hypothetical protein A9K65_005995 [Mesorhizobium sp. WSM1497]|nr:hypothetical protein A9K65_005995 [Mesorhizobium sp. WSM1497]